MRRDIESIDRRCRRQLLRYTKQTKTENCCQRSKPPSCQKNVQSGAAAHPARQAYAVWKHSSRTKKTGGAKHQPAKSVDEQAVLAPPPLVTYIVARPFRLLYASCYPTATARKLHLISIDANQGKPVRETAAALSSCCAPHVYAKLSTRCGEAELRAAMLNNARRRSTLLLPPPLLYPHPCRSYPAYGDKRLSFFRADRCSTSGLRGVDGGREQVPRITSGEIHFLCIGV